jgi:SulP family sulfate permease
MKPELLNSLKGYKAKNFMGDLVAGVITGIVALPLAIAFAIASGVPPDRGLYTAIIAGFIISVLGGSRVQIGGPTGAFVVIVYAIIQKFGLAGLATATIMAGAILLILGLCKLGGLIKFIPYTIITGFTAGIALTIFTSQIGDFLGLTVKNAPGDFLGKIAKYGQCLSTFNPVALGVAVSSLAVIILWPKINKKIPGSLIAIIAATLVVWIFKLPVETIGSRFGSIPAGLPAPVMPSFSIELIGKLLPSAFSIAILAAIESLLSAVVADGMTGYRHDSNMELVAQGIANLLTPLFGGIPATGAIARTATNIKNGGRSPIAGIIHALTLLAIIVFLGKLAAFIPMPTLAAVLVFVSYNMIETHAIKSIVRGQKSDTLVLAVTFLITVFIDLTVAIEVGLVLAGFLFIKKMIDASTVKALKDEVDEPGAGKLDPNSLNLRKIPKGAMVFEIEGPLFFGSIQKFEEAVQDANIKYKVLVLRMRNTIYLDAGGLRVLEELRKDCVKKRVRLLISDIHTQPLMLTAKAGFDKKIGEEFIFGNLDAALVKAAEILGMGYVAEPHEPTVEREGKKDGC